MYNTGLVRGDRRRAGKGNSHTMYLSKVPGAWRRVSSADKAGFFTPPPPIKVALTAL